jgi:stearoyl-CoA desaturase (delta-9 desaturase)
LASLLGLAKNLKKSTEKSILEARLAVIEELIRADNESHAAEEPTSYPKMNAAQMRRKIKAGGVLFIVDGYVVDVKAYIQDHPGGAEVLYSFVGTDATDAFRGGVNTHSTHAERLLKNFRIAKFEST